MPRLVAPNLTPGESYSIFQYNSLGQIWDITASGGAGGFVNRVAADFLDYRTETQQADELGWIQAADAVDDTVTYCEIRLDEATLDASYVAWFIDLRDVRVLELLNVHMSYVFTETDYFENLYGSVGEMNALISLQISERGNAEDFGADWIELQTSTASDNDDFYNFSILHLNGGVGGNRGRVIIDYDGALKRAFVDRPWTLPLPLAPTAYSIFKSTTPPLDSTGKVASVGGGGGGNNVQVSVENVSVHD